MHYILYSADYEIFMCKNFISEKATLIEPTQILLDLCSSLSIPMTLFCDYLCLNWFNDRKLSQFPHAVAEQLKYAISQQHDVQTHLHPHWPHTDQANNKFSYDHRHFLLGGSTESEEECYLLASRYLKEAKKYFSDLLKPINPSYECVAYRAGGYGIQPHDRAIFKALKDTGYIIDSSIVPGMILNNHVNKVDFSQLPSPSNYWISHEKGIKESSLDKNGIFEVPLASGTFTSLDRFLILKDYFKLAFKRMNKKNRPQLRGESIQENNPAGTKKTFIDKVRDRLDIRWGFLECSTNLELMKRVAIRFIQKHKNNPNDLYFSFSCHPKSMHEEHFKNLKLFHVWLQQYLKNEVMAISYQQAAKQILKS